MTFLDKTLINFGANQILMKNLFLFLLSLCSYIAGAQAVSYGSFKVSAEEIVYQKIFAEDSATVPSLEAYYKALPYVSNLVAESGNVQFDVSDIRVDYKKFEFSQMNTPSIIQTGKYSGHVSIGIKDGKYRVTVQSIMVTGDIGYKKITTPESLTNYACKNSGTILAPDWCRPNMLGLLDKAFTDKLQYIPQKKKVAKEEW
jgi:hypothetical protein